MEVAVTYAKGNDRVYGEREQIVFSNVRATGFSYGYAYIARTDTEKRLNKEAFPFIVEAGPVEIEGAGDRVIIDHIPLAWIIEWDVTE